MIILAVRTASEKTCDARACSASHEVRKETIVMNIRNVLISVIVPAVLVGIVSCGGGSGYGSGGGTPMYTYTVGGTVSGLSETVVLQLNGAGNLTMSASGGFTFAGSLANSSTYNVTVLTQPASQTCSIANGAGTLSGANVTNVSVTCVVTGVVIRSASLTGAQEVPPTGATGTGRGAVVINPTTREITGGISFTGLTANPTAGAHIHRADNTIVFGLDQTADIATTATVPAGTTPATGQVLSVNDYAELLAGTLYFNVHTVANPGGEIRGQINIQGGVIAGLAPLNGAQEGNTSTATGRGTIVLDSTTRAILIAYVTHNVAGANAAHIHTGAPGVSGPANVVTLTAGTNVYTAPVSTTATPTTLSAQNVTDLNAGNTYFNVHSGTFPNGEIRGQIVVQ